MTGHYLLTAWRNILKSKSHAAINVIGFAIGMACCVVILLYIRDELSYDRHNSRGDRIYRVVTDRTARTPGALGEFIRTQLPEAVEVLRLRATIGIWLFTTEDKQFYEQGVYWADGNLFDVFDVPLVQGNPATALTAPNTMVISTSMARKYFGEENPLGQVITGNTRLPFTITAVMDDPPVYAHYHPDSYISIATTSGRGDPLRLLSNWASSEYYTYLLLAPGTPPDEMGGVSIVLPLFRTLTGHLLAMPSLEPWSLLGGAGIVIGVGIVAGSYPALMLSRISPATIFRAASDTGAAFLRRHWWPPSSLSPF